MATKSKFTIEQLIEFLYEPILQKRLIRFYYESKSGKRWRIIRPYIVMPVGINIQLVGTPIEELNKPLSKRQAGHYIITNLDMNKFEILSEQFDDPGVPRDIVKNTKGKVICRFIYDDEDEKEVRSQWIKLSDL